MKIEEMQRKNGYKTVRFVTTFPMKEVDIISGNENKRMKASYSLNRKVITLGLYT
jgi:hypothetical protein